MKIIKNNKGFSLSLQTIVKIVILLVVLAIILYFLFWGKGYLMNLSIPGL